MTVVTTSELRAKIELRPSIDVSAWRAAHEAGEKPDKTPYGLDRLSERGVNPEFSAPRDKAASKLVTVANRRLGGGFDWVNSGGRVSKQDADVRVCWEEWDGISAAATRRRNDAAVFTGAIWLAEDGALESRLWRRVAAEALAKCAGVWVLSEAQVPALVSEWGLDESRVHYLKFGINEDFWSVTGSERARTGVVSVGNDQHRDHPTLISAMSTLARSSATSSDAALTLVTREQYDVDPQVGRRLDSVSHVELRSIYESSAVFAAACKPNLHVSGMTAILEAQSMGLPVVCTDTPGIRDYVIDGVTALLVPVGDSDALAAAVGSLLADPQRRLEMGRAGTDYVSREHSTSHLADRMADMIHETMQTY